MSDEDFFMNEEVPKNQADDSESDLEDDWDVDEDEVAAKKAAKEAAKKAELEKEAERVRKLKERKAAEKAAEEERVRKLNEQKTREQLEEELEQKAYEECQDFLGGVTSSTNNLQISTSTTPVDDDPDNPMAMEASASKSEPKTVVIEAPVVKREKDLYNFKPNCKPACDDYAKMLTKQMFELKNDKVVAKNFNYLLESCMKSLCNEVPIDNWETVKKLGTAISAIGNSKQQEFKKKDKKKGGKKNTKPTIKANKGGDSFGGGDDEYVEDFDGFM